MNLQYVSGHCEKRIFSIDELPFTVWTFLITFAPLQKTNNFTNLIIK